MSTDIHDRSTDEFDGSSLSNQRAQALRSAGSGQRHGRSWAFAAVLAVVVAAVTATGSSASDSRMAARLAQGVDGVVSQVQASFGDGHIRDAMVSGSTLAVKLTASDESSLTTDAFEAQILASAVRAWMTTNGLSPIDAVAYLDADGTQLQGLQPEDAIMSTPIVSSLSPSDCGSGASAAQASVAGDTLTVTSARTLPYMNGACVIDFRTTNPASFAAAAPVTMGKLVDALGSPDERPYLVRVVDQAGTPQFVASYVPGVGGQAYVKPGLSHAFFAGGQSHGGS